ncbi:MoaD/ThiS family protein [Streptomyces pseudovenezuelae]|uniref:MoaD/ThiS family protein n=1 Tax=Streptomyces pseudovenezuelae TaxID=67350 RepID=UPI0036EF3CEE
MPPDVHVVIPEFLFGGHLLSGNGEPVNAADLEQLRTLLNLRHSPAAARLWDESGTVRRNVIVVRNGELVPRTEHALLRFDDGDEIEFVLQFAGG